MVPFIFTAASLITISNAILNNRQANASPCQTPFLTLMGSENLFCILTRHLTAPYPTTLPDMQIT